MFGLDNTILSLEKVTDIMNDFLYFILPLMLKLS